MGIATAATRDELLDRQSRALDMWFKFILAFSAILSPLLMFWMQQKKDESVVEKLDKAAVVAQDTHTLVNKNYGVQLSLNAGNARWKANTTKDQADIKAADDAEALLRDHEKQQAVVDAGKDIS